ncbi:hypothetical protein IAS59_000164 [Cryptococcus gattii]
MPDLLTPQALATAGPLLLDTLFKHYLSPRQRSDDDKNKAREDLMYDEAFVLMKTFLEMATKHPVSALQRFGQVRTLSPPWVAVHRVQVPFSSLQSAAEYIVTAFGGEEMTYKIAGGTKWWQVRAGQGVEAEWIVMKKDWKEVVEEEKRENEKRNGKKKEAEGEPEDDDFLPEMDRLRCMLYIHGGAYYWGSINTHRYTIWRHARKMHGRCFAVNYRKAPQYPFPCAIQDCLAAYLYLVKPPLGAPHRPVDPKSIVLAGDSAGGGLCLALLQILRDTPGLELPAGAALLSPWSDLTHSFPSILQNTATDIVPPYSFIHKPSSLWPPPPPTLTHAVQSRLRSRVKEAAARIREHDQEAKSKKSHSEGIKGDKLYSVVSRISTRSHGKVNQRHDNPEGDSGVESSNVVHASAPSEAKTSDSPTSSPSTLHPTASSPTDPNAHPTPREGPPNPTFANPASLFRTLVPPSPNETRPTTLAQCTTPLSLKVKDEKVVLDTQIQIYATNAQLCHPWVSPVLGYLGGLPPLYIMCGDKEVLRDEIIYLAHKAANPSDHSLRPDVVALSPSLEEIESRYGPTNVHLQVYDGVCHDLPLFSMTTAARGCFRAIASFARYVTPSTPGSLYIGRNPSVAEESDVSTPATPNTFITPIASVDAEQRDKILGAPMASSPVQATPHPSQVSLRPNGVTSPPLCRKEPLSSEIPSLSELRIQNLDRSLEGTAGLERANGKINEMKEQKKKEVGILPPRRGTSLRESFTPSGSGLQNTSMTPITSATGDEVLGDDTGPRFAFGTSDQKKENGGKGVEFEKREEQAKEGEEGYSGLNDSRAKKGEAGWPGIYRGDNPFTDHMIRERVSNIEIGKIKEGPAMRYINGQKLWDKKYRRTAERVKKRREKNLLQAHKAGEKVGKRLEGVVRESMRAEKAKKRKERIKEKVKGKKLDEEDEDESETESSVKDGPTTVGTSMTWTWALKGEAPPPSAIVSRRDFSEARQLALMADRIDSSVSHSTPLHGLNIWVGLAGFFSTSAEKEKTKAVLKQVKEEKGNKAKSVEDDPGEIGERKKSRGKVWKMFHWGKKK